MPIKSVIVDYGNGVIKDSGDTNFYKNRYGYKSDGTSACDGLGDDGKPNFGHSTNACDEAYFSYQTDYTCRGSGTLPTCSLAKTSGCWNATCPDTTVTGGCCVFVPKVQVLDNWGWCNGTCTGRTSGCYGIECDVVRRKSDPHWTNFAGQILVVPR